MSLKISCDRCGYTTEAMVNLDNEVAMNFQWQRIVDSYEGTLYDLCPDCCTSLDSWINKPCDSEASTHGR